MGKYICFICIMISGTNDLWPQETQICAFQEYATSMINPSYTGTRSVNDFVILNRQQWAGFTGAPNSFLMLVNIPGKSRYSGFGLDLGQHSAGPMKQMDFFLRYSYKVKLSDQSDLSFGIRGGMKNYSISLSDLILTESGDALFESDIEQLFLPNFGVGVHYSFKSFYLDFAIPLLIRNELTPGGREGLNENSRENRLYHMQTAYKTTFSRDLILKSYFAFWLSEGIPPQLAIGTRLWLRETAGLGIHYNSSGSIGLLFQYGLLHNLFLGYAYELPLAYNFRLSSGTHEVVLAVDFQFLKQKTQSPRRF